MVAAALTGPVPGQPVLEALNVGVEFGGERTIGAVGGWLRESREHRATVAVGSGVEG
jgi:hypothetical protein